ncbi:MAG TPA: translocation/assembly module TamB domain-containing protein [Steroidobacteraceae bacterium]|jgi:translocation and assembly module TamB|nr:translocation/assembly module TamB domain-containing protein [Steroidobacteraceae bacterium]
MLRWLHLCWSIPLLLAVMALGAIDYLAFTPAGCQFVARALNRQIGPVKIEIHGARGTIAHALHVDLLVIDHRRVHIEIENADGQMAIMPLAWRTISISRLHAERVLVHVLPHIDDGRYWEPHFLPPLTRIDAKMVEADRLRLQYPSGRVFDTTKVDASSTLFPKIIRIHDGGFDHNLVHVRATGDVLATQAIGLRGALRFFSHPDGQPFYIANARIDGDTAKLGLNFAFDAPFGARFHGDIDHLTSHWHWQGHAHVGRFDLAAWNAGHALGILTGDLLFDGNATGFSAQGTVVPPGLRSGPLLARFRGDYNDTILTVTSLQLDHAVSGTVATASGEVAFVSGGPRLDLHGSWTHFRWPMNANDAPFHSDHGSYTLQQLRPYAFTTTADFQFTDAPAMHIAMRGRLASDSVTAEHAELETLGAHTDLAGMLRWNPASTWQLRGHVADLDVATLRPGVRGSLAFAFEANGEGYSRESPLEATVHDVAGNVRGQRAQGHARIAHRGGDWQFSDVRLQLGATRLELEGHAGTTLDLDFGLEASDLALLDPGAHGQLNANGHIRGDRHDPTVLSTAHARDLEWRGMRLASLDGHIEFDPHGSGRADSQLELRDLTVQGRRLDRLTLGSTGTADNHSLSIEARAEGYSLNIKGNGRYAAGSWQGEIASAQLGDGARLHMTQEAPAAVLLDGNRMRLEPLCLHDAQTRLCLKAHSEEQHRAVELNATNMPMRAMTAGLTNATDYDGSLSVSLNAAATGDEPWRGELKATLEDAAIRKHFPNGRTETLNLGNGTVAARIREHDLSGELALDAGGAGHVAGHFTAHPGSAGSGCTPAAGGEPGAGGSPDDDGDWHLWPLSGDLSLETTALGYVSTYVGQIDRASGRIRAKLALSGCAASPRLAGELQLVDAALDAYQINLSLRAVNLTARLNDDHLNIDGSAQAGPDGRASVSGDLRWQHALPYGDIHLTGQDLRVVSIPEARVDVSPDVFVHMEGRRIDVRGNVNLPYARIEPANLANAVLASEDEVIVGAPKTAPEDQYQIFSNLTLVLGERVTVNAHGLSGRLSGRINVATDDSGISHGSGELNVEEGKYLAYGRNLDVEHGRLLFSNGLLNDPGLDLRAEKKFPDITAGINVRGTLRSPRMTFFSSPEVPQSQIVSLLLAGGSLQSVTNATDTNEHSTSGRSDAIMQGGAILAQQLGGRYNIEAGVEQDMMNETSLVLGRYLSPRLYVSYGVGLAEAINTIKMRYTIGDHWTVKTEAGTQRSADLVFTIEK